MEEEIFCTNLHFDVGVRYLTVFSCVRAFVHPGTGIKVKIIKRSRSQFCSIILYIRVYYTMGFKSRVENKLLELYIF